MKRLVNLFLALCLLVTLSGVAAAEDNIVLDFWTRTGDDFSVEIAAFEAAHPGVTINAMGKGSYDDLVTAYNTAILADELPDAGIVCQRYGIPQLYDAGVLVPADEYLTDEEKADIFENLWYRYSYKGVYCAVPFQSSTAVLHYNATMLKELGLEPPETIEEMLECGRKAVKDLDGDGMTDVYGLVTASDTPFYVQPLILAMGGSLVDDQGNANVIIPEAEKVFDLFAQMVREGIMPANQHATATDDFVNGAALFYMSSCAMKESLQEMTEGKFEYNVTYFPGDVQRNVCIGGNGLAVFKNTEERQKLAEEFVRYMITPEAIRESTLRHGYMPFSTSQFADEYIQEQLKDPIWAIILDQVQYIHGQPIHPTDSLLWNGIVDIISQIEAYPDTDINAELVKWQAEIDEYMMMY